MKATEKNLAKLSRWVDQINAILSRCQLRHEWLHEGSGAMICDADGGPSSGPADGREVWIAVDVCLHSTHGQQDEVMRDAADAETYRALERAGFDLNEDGTGTGDGYSIVCYRCESKSSVAERRAESRARRMAREEEKRRESALVRAKAATDWQSAKSIRLFTPDMGGQFVQMQPGESRVRARDGATVVCLESGTGWYLGRVD